MSNNISRRFKEHKTKSKKHSTVLSRAFLKYGVNNFSFEVIEYVSSIEDLPNREQYWIGKLDPRYNMNFGGNGNRGYVVKESAKQILRIKAKAQWDLLSFEEKQFRIKNNLTGPKKGHLVSEATRKKISQNLTGLKKSDASKSKLSASQKISMIGNKNGNKRILMADSNDIVVKWFDSVLDASKFINVHPSNISKCLKGVQKSTGGYKFKYI